MLTFEELNRTNSTVVEVEGNTLKTIQDPSPSDDGTTYTAPAIDSAGNEYIIAWEIIDPEITDESSICNWKKPIGVTLVK